jgi:LysR family transcriptional regulator, glycine cleavage system transcriptional activator
MHLDEVNVTPRSTRPPLAAIRVFECVGRSKSLRRAAADLGITHTAISQHIRELETYVGAKLVNTSPLGSSLSDDGRRFHVRVKEAFDTLAAAVEELRPSVGRRSLRIWAAPGFAAQWLMPRYRDLEQRLADTEIVLRPTELAADILRNEADIDIRYGERAEPGLFSEILMRPETVAVCSPDWLQDNPQACDPATLLGMPLIHEQNHEEWQRWFEATGIADVPPLKGPRFWNAATAVEAARLGFGPALANRQIIADDLSASRLVQIAETSVALEPYTMTMRKDRVREAEIAGFVCWIRSTLRKPN